MAGTRYDFTLKQGSDVDFVIQVYADKARTTPMNLTGWDARMMIRSMRDAVNPPLVSLTSNPAAGLTVNGPAGQVTVHIAGSASSAFTWLNGQYDLEVYNSSTQAIMEAAYGNVSIRTEVTR